MKKPIIGITLDNEEKDREIEQKPRENKIKTKESHNK